MKPQELGYLEEFPHSKAARGLRGDGADGKAARAEALTLAPLQDQLVARHRLHTARRAVKPASKALGKRGKSHKEAKHAHPAHKAAPATHKAFAHKPLKKKTHRRSARTVKSPLLEAHETVVRTKRAPTRRAHPTKQRTVTHVRAKRPAHAKVALSPPRKTPARRPTTAKAKTHTRVRRQAAPKTHVTRHAAPVRARKPAAATATPRKTPVRRVARSHAVPVTPTKSARPRHVPTVRPSVSRPVESRRAPPPVSYLVTRTRH